jgi:hypothetical protein
MAILWLEGSGKLKKFDDLIGNQTRDLLAYSIVPQPSMLPQAQLTNVADYKQVLILYKAQNAFHNGLQVTFHFLNTRQNFNITVKQDVCI